MDNLTAPEVITAAETGEEPLLTTFTSEDFAKVETGLLAENCIKKHVIAAMGLGLVPSAIVDVVGITAIEIKMIRDMAHIYNFPIPKKQVLVKILISLIGSIGPVYLSFKARSSLKGVPLLGYAFHIGMMSIMGGAAVYAVGKIFQKHFESGGTFLSKDNKFIREYFRKKYDEGKLVVKEYAIHSKNVETPA